MDSAGTISGEIFTKRGRVIPSSFFKHSAQDILGCFYFDRIELLNFIKAGTYSSIDDLARAVMESEIIIRPEVPMGHISLFS